MYHNKTIELVRYCNGRNHKAWRKEGVKFSQRYERVWSELWFYPAGQYCFFTFCIVISR